MKPDELLEKLKETATPRAGKTLDTIYEICREQEQRGLGDFSVATIARLGHKRGVPKAQSLRNKTGEPYRALLRCFEAQHRSDEPEKEDKGEDDWIEEIQNPKHRLLARIQASELAAANKSFATSCRPEPGLRSEITKINPSTKKAHLITWNAARWSISFLTSSLANGVFRFQNTVR